MRKYSKILFLLLLFSCNNLFHKDIDPIISEETAATLLNKYDSETFNYFYETVFSRDKLSTICKWSTDIKIFVKGNPSTQETLFIDNIIENHNSLNLPIKVKRTFNLEEANVIVYFDTMENLSKIFNLSHRTYGVAVSNSKHGTIYKSEIGIVEKEGNRSLAVLIEELTQILGISSDSYSYPESVFFEAVNFQTELTELDKNVLKLIYDPLIPINLSRSNFENSFASILNHINYEKKIRGYIDQHQLSESILLSTKECFIDGEFYKHPKTIPVYLKGEFSIKDSLHTSHTIKDFNQLQNVKFELKKYNSDELLENGIILSFAEISGQVNDLTSELFISRGEKMFPKRVKSEVFIKYNKNADNIQGRKLKHITKVIFKCLGPINSEDVFINENPISLNAEQLELLRFIYSDVFIDGLKLTEYEKILNEI